MDSSTQDRNLPASERRLQKAREDGQAPRSRDLTHLVVLGGGMVLLSALTPWGYERLRHAMRAQMSFTRVMLDHPENLSRVLGDTVLQGLAFVLPLGLLLLGLVTLATVASGAFAYSVKPLMPEFSKISPLSGFGRLFSRQQFFEVLKLTTYTAVLVIIGGMFLKSHLFDFGSLLMRPLDAAMPQLNQWMTMGIAGLLSVVALVAIIDVPLQHHLHKHRLRMSMQEVKQEHKESDGDPHVKGKRRQIQRELAQGNSVGRVPGADLVVMNPTHYAVALKYDADTMVAPRVIAKGADLVAMRIRDLARESKVPVLQSPMLARALYAHTEIDHEIPSALFTAVAQVLAYVYQLRAAMRGEGPMPGEQPTPDVPPELDPHHKRKPQEALA
ncbi:EscU/YscU/HrcU family type III secretion system export apparatus switch protein [Hydrogenophaga sp. OTU3427]|uniref:EscU/YscU/HrcU family type III secretion system export apparatus switch protein n=1 Tax=Hydrogenophaga sp. OTU3427 TaxID=3043856 RepID=UPI00313EF7C9